MAHGELISLSDESTAAPSATGQRRRSSSWIAQELAYKVTSIIQSQTRALRNKQTGRPEGLPAPATRPPRQKADETRRTMINLSAW